MKIHVKMKRPTRALVVFVVITLSIGAGGLRNVEILIPDVVSTGSTATLLCHYDLEGDPLYTVKWYKGRQEFFRFMPKENPRTRLFPLPGANVDMSLSGANRVVLRDVEKELTGKYRCEVSTDAPDFHTKVVSAHMNVVDILKGNPLIVMEKTSYSIGDTLRGNCTAPASAPAANITFIVNGNKVNASYLIRNKAHGDNVQTIGGLQLEVNTFLGRKLKIVCIADLFKVYNVTSEIWLDEERPRLASVLGTRDSSSAQSCELATHAAETTNPTPAVAKRTEPELSRIQYCVWLLLIGFSRLYFAR